MGAWGTGSFENDDALDWLHDLERTDGLEVVFETLTERDGDRDAGERVIAACEVVAALNGHPSPAPNEDLADWLADKTAPGSEVTLAAREALEWVWTSSELRALWEDSEHFEEWGAVIADLRARLEAEPVERELRPRDMAKFQAKQDHAASLWDEQYPLNQEGAPGDLIGIPLSDGRLALAFVLDYEPRGESPSLAGGVGVVYRVAITPEEMAPTEAPPLSDAIACLAMGWSYLESGAWKILRRGLDDRAAREAQRMALASNRGAGADPAKGRLGCVIIDELVHAYHGLRPWNYYPGGCDVYQEYLLSDDLAPEGRTYLEEE